MAGIKKSEHKSYGMGLHDEVLTGRTQQTFFNPEEAENFFYHDAFDVDFNKRTTIDVEKLESHTHNCTFLNRRCLVKIQVSVKNYDLLHLELHA